MKSVSKIELLAPAADYNVALSAIAAGADAIYIGASRFSARSAAGNSIEDIRRVCSAARPFGVRVYLALNTLLLTDDELLDARQTALDAIEAGVDAIIFQDVRILDFNLPIELHASTQTTQLTVQRALEFQQAGVSRIVLERGLSISEIQQIAQGTDVELEVFIHGAICVGYSGICYLSEHLAGRSGNRGECAQPCRSRYNLIDGRGNIVIRDEALLSPRDLNLTNRIGELIDAGVHSLKIEGRLKDSNYVTNIVAHYHTLLQKLGVERTSWGRTTLEFKPDVRLSFNRGFTEWFFDGTSKGERGVQRLAQSSEVAGEYIGEITRVESNYIEIHKSTNIEIANGDGLSYRDSELRVQGVRVNRSQGSRLFLLSTEGLEVNMKLYRNRSMEFKPIAMRVIDITINVTQQDNNYIITARDPLGRSTAISTPIEHYQTANNIERAVDNLTKALTKSGGTIFNVQSVDIECQKIPFMPSSIVNGLRRELLDKLLEVLSIPEHRDYNRASSLGLNNSTQSSLMRTRYCILREKGLCLSESKLPQPLYLLNNHVKVALRFDCKRCEMYLEKMEDC